MKESITIDFAGRPLTISTGTLAQQASGAVLVEYDDTVVLVTAVTEREVLDKDFMPLLVNYQEMAYAAGRFPGGFFKREGRPSDKEVLSSRLIDRPLRPLFPKGYRHDTQVVATVLSSDQQNDPAMLGIIGASAALYLSQAPFTQPLAAVKMGRKNGEFIVNPKHDDMEESDMDIVVAGTKDAIMMVEGSARFVAGSDLIEAIDMAHKSMQPIIELQEQLREKAGKKKWVFEPVAVPEELKNEIRAAISTKLTEAFSIPVKQDRQDRLSEIQEELLSGYQPTEASLVRKCFEEISKHLMRSSFLEKGVRIDGRSAGDIRPITCAVGVLPRTHGSALFTRGETQALTVTTFGTSEDEQKVEALLGGETYKSFMLHYNFLPFSVGEVRPLRGPSRREVGHGNLAERALTPIIPDKEAFPYTIRIVSEILASNGSSSMASVCAGCLSLMDAGVPIKEPVAGVAMGLMLQDGKDAILTDILGDEDAMGDMDFKVAGTKDAVTAIQMDIKTPGITKEIMGRAVKMAQDGIVRILSTMGQTLDKPREVMSPYAPRIWTMKVRQEKIREVIGPGGKMIKSIIEQTGVKIDIEDSGLVKIVSHDETSAQAAIDMIKRITKDIEVGSIHTGIVRRVADFGAIVEFLPGVDGLCHVSQLSDTYIKNVSDVVKEGDELTVKVLDVEPNGRIRLSHKAVLLEEKKKGQDV
jgi:polyribonucleotide nucleotidyltransferase